MIYFKSMFQITHGVLLFMEGRYFVNELIHIGNKEILVKEFRGQRVVTFKDIDLVHERPDGTAGRNFRDNKKHFIEGEDYFRRNPSEAKEEFGVVAPNGIYLITEQGYLMLVKSFTDDLAWDVQRQLVNHYFKRQPERTIAYQYPVSPAAMESATNAGRLLERVMRRESAAPHEVAYVVKQLFNQVGIDIPECAVKIPTYEQVELQLTSVLE